MSSIYGVSGGLLGLGARTALNHRALLVVWQRLQDKRDGPLRMWHFCTEVES